MVGSPFDSAIRPCWDAAATLTPADHGVARSISVERAFKSQQEPMTQAREVSDEEYARINRELEHAQELKAVDTSKMTLAEKVEHQRAVKAAWNRARRRE